MRIGVKNRADWHGWFAWFPVTIAGQRVWLEVIDRRLSETFCGSEWQYALRSARAKP